MKVCPDLCTYFFWSKNSSTECTFSYLSLCGHNFIWPGYHTHLFIVPSRLGGIPHPTRIHTHTHTTYTQMHTGTTAHKYRTSFFLSLSLSMSLVLSLSLFLSLTNKYLYTYINTQTHTHTQTGCLLSHYIFANACRHGETN